MNKYLTIRANKYCKPGTYWIAEIDGDPLFRCQMTAGPRGMHLTQVSRVAIPFYELAPYIVPLGFQVSKDELRRLEHTAATQVQKPIDDFQRSVEDIIEPEVERRGQRDNPTPAQRAARVRRGKYIPPDSDE